MQVEKYLHRHEVLSARHGQAAVLEGLDEAEREVALEFLTHARALRAIRAQGDPAVPLRVLRQLQAWGGVTLVYRKPIENSPAWRLTQKKWPMRWPRGVTLLDEHQPLSIDIDEYRRVCAIRLQRADEPQPLHLPARSVFVAAGTQPNAIVAGEFPGQFTTRDGYLASVHPRGAGTGPKSAHHDFFCRIEADGRRISFVGDAHPAFAGNVVRAMASAKRAAPVIDAALRALPPRPAGPDFTQFANELADRWQARVTACRELAPGIIELAVRAPSAARAFQPGQFYRLQNFETLAGTTGNGPVGTRPGMEGLAMTGAWVERDSGVLGMIVLESGASSDLVRRLRPGDPVVLMGPTGQPTEIVGGETVLLVGGGLGNAVLFSIGAALRAAGSNVLYLAAYRRNRDRFRIADIEAAADTVIWCVDEAPDFVAGRPGDAVFHGNVVQALLACRDRHLGQRPIRLADIDRLIAIGSDRMMAAVAAVVRGELATTIKPNCRFIASINSPMQCMMKEICGQCLQWQQDPVSGRPRLVFSCNTQDQPMLAVDFANLADRLAQNGAQEKQARQWLALQISLNSTD
ncbi:MAG: hypothetical protein R3E68_20565 [Burkholderiaceae bacterium]